MTTKVLILDAHSDAALACVQSLGRAGEYEIHLGGGTREAASFSSRFVAERYQYPDPQIHREAFVRWLRALDAAEAFDFVLPITDATVLPLHELRGELRAELILPPAEALPWAFNKDKTVELAKRVDVPVPAGRLVQSLEEARGVGDYPLYLKPVSSKVWRGQRGRSLSPCMVHSDEELTRQLPRLLSYGPVLVQEYFGGHGVGIEVLCDRGEVVLAFAHRRVHEYPLTGGRSTYRVSIPAPESLLNASKRLLGELGWHGVAMVEFKQRGEDFRLMEINGRFWGSLPLAVASGVDFPRVLLELYRDGKRPRQVRYREGVYARNLMADAAWLLANVRAPRNQPLLLTRPRLLSLLEPLRLLAGREVWDHFSLRDPGPGAWQIRRMWADATGKAATFLRHRRLLRGARAQSVARLRNRKPRRLLILCYGNIYRSAFAERYLAQRLRGYPDIEIRSAGFYPESGRRSAPRFVELCREYGVDLRPHRSRRVDPDLVRWADAVLIMDRRNWDALSAYGPAASDKAIWFGALSTDTHGDSVEIMDPDTMSDEGVRQIVERLRRSADAWVDHLTRESGLERAEVA